MGEGRINLHMSKFKKIAAFGTLFFYLVSGQGTPAFAQMASPAPAGPAVSARELLNLSFFLPPHLGNLEEWIPASEKNNSDHPFILHIQTAHGDYATQKAIDRILTFLKRHEGLDLVLLEGAASRLEPEQDRYFSRPAWNRAVAKDRLKQGRMSGAAYFLMKEPQVRAFGIESAEAYRKNRAAFLRLLGAQPSVEIDLHQRQLRLDRLYSQRASKTMRDFRRKQIAFETGTLDFNVWTTELKTRASVLLNLDLTHVSAQKDWPALVRFFKLQKISRSGIPAANLPAPDFKNELFQNLFGVAQHAGGGQGSRAFRYGEVRVRAETWLVAQNPQEIEEKTKLIKPWLLPLTLQNEIRSPELQNEIESLTTRILKALASSKEDRRLNRSAADLKLLRGLLRGELAFDEYQEVLKRPQDIRRAAANLRHRAPARVERDFNNALDFYRGAKARERLMVQNIETILKREHSKGRVIALVTGGFHAAGLKQEFARRGFSYGRITPAARNFGKFSFSGKKDPRDFYRHAFLKHSHIEDAAALAQPRTLLHPLGLSLKPYIADRTDALRQWSSVALRDGRSRRTAVREFNQGHFARDFGVRAVLTNGRIHFTRQPSVRSEVRSTREPDWHRIVETELKQADQILKNFPRGQVAEFSKIQALLAALYGGSVQIHSEETMSSMINNEQHAWIKKTYHFRWGLLALNQPKNSLPVPVGKDQKSRIKTRIQSLLKTLGAHGIRADETVLSTAAGKSLKIGDILTKNPAFQNPFLHTFLGETSKTGVFSAAQSRLERVQELLKLTPGEINYLRHFDNIFIPDVRLNETEPFVIRAQHNNVLGPYKGGERLVTIATIRNDKHFMRLFNDLRRHFNLQEARYFLRKYFGLEEAIPLAFGMTTKTAVAGLPFGGAKSSMLAADVYTDEAGQLIIRRNVRAAAEELETQNYVLRLARSFARAEEESGTVSERNDIPAADLNSGGGLMDIKADEHLESILDRLQPRFQRRLEKLQQLLNQKNGHAAVKDKIKQAALKQDLEFLKKLWRVFEKQNTPESLRTPLFLEAVTGYLTALRDGGRKVPVWAKPFAMAVAAYTSKSADLSGSIFRNEATGHGGIHVVKEIILRDKAFARSGITSLKGMTAKIMGVGNVGAPAVIKMIEEGVRLQLISEGAYGGISKAEGFSLEDLAVLKKLFSQTGGYSRLNQAGYEIAGAEYIPAEAIDAELLGRETDLFVLSAVENALDAGNIDRAKGRIYIELANGGITNEAYDRLIADPHKLVIPDTIANAGGVIVSYFEWMQNQRNERWDKETVVKKLEEKLTASIDRVDQIRHGFGNEILDWRTAADVLMARDVLAARRKQRLKQRQRLQRSEVRTEPAATPAVARVLFADHPANLSTLASTRQFVVETFGPAAEVIAASGMGKDGDALKKIIETERPTVILIRSDTTLFGPKDKGGEPEYLAEAARLGVRVIIRMGSGTDNIDKEAAKQAGIAVIPTKGNENSVGNLAMRFLIASLGYGTDLQQASVPDLALSDSWQEVLNIPIDQFLAVLANSKGRGEIFPRHQTAVFHTTSFYRLQTLLRTHFQGETLGLIGASTTAMDFAKKLAALRRLSGIDFTIMASSPKLDRGDPLRTVEADRLGILHPGEAAVLAQSKILSFHVSKTKTPVFDKAKLQKAAKLRTILNLSRAEVIAPDIWPEFFVRPGALFFGDLDLIVKGQPVAALEELRSRYPNQAILSPHSAASTVDAGEGVEKSTLPVLHTVLIRLFGLPASGEPVALDIINGVTIEPLAPRSEMRTAPVERPQYSPEAAAGARAVTFFGIRDDLLETYSHYKAARDDEPQREVLLQHVRERAPQLDAFIHEIRADPKAPADEAALLASYEQLNGDDARQKAFDLGVQIKAYDQPMDVQRKAYQRAVKKTDVAGKKAANQELNRLSHEVVLRAKRRLKIQLLRLRAALQNDPKHQGPIFSYLISINDLYQRISAEYLGRSMRSDNGAPVARLLIVNPFGEVAETLPYQTPDMLRIEQSDSGFDIWQTVWKYVKVDGGPETVMPVRTRMHFEADSPIEAAAKALRSRKHALESEQEDHAILLQHDQALQGLIKILEPYLDPTSQLTDELRDTILDSIENLLIGPGGSRGLRKRIAATGRAAGTFFRGLPMPRDSLEKRAKTHIVNGEIKAALEALRSAQQWTRARRRYIETSTAPATRRKRDTIHFLTRDMQLQAALENLNTLVLSPYLTQQVIDKRTLALRIIAEQLTLRGLHKTYLSFIVQHYENAQEIAFYRHLQARIPLIVATLGALSDDFQRGRDTDTTRMTARRVQQQAQELIETFKQMNARRLERLGKEKRARSEVRASFSRDELSNLPDDLQRAVGVYAQLLLLDDPVTEPVVLPADTELSGLTTPVNKVRMLVMSAGRLINFGLQRRQQTAAIALNAQRFFFKAAEIYRAASKPSLVKKADTLEALSRHAEVLVELLARKYRIETEAANLDESDGDARGGAYSLTTPAVSAASVAVPVVQAVVQTPMSAGAHAQKPTVKKPVKTSGLQKYFLKPLFATGRALEWTWYQIQQQPWWSMAWLAAVTFALTLAYQAVMESVFGKDLSDDNPIMINFVRTMFGIGTGLSVFAYIQIKLWVSDFGFPGGARAKWEPRRKTAADVPEATLAKMAAEEERQQTGRELTDLEGRSEVRLSAETTPAVRVAAAEQLLDGFFLPDDLQAWEAQGSLPPSAARYLMPPVRSKGLANLLAQTADLWARAQAAGQTEFALFAGEPLGRHEKRTYILGPEFVRRYGPVLLTLEQAAPARLIVLAKDTAQARTLENLTGSINSRLPKTRRLMVKTPIQARNLLKAETLRGLGLGEIDAALLREFIPDFLPLNSFELDRWASQIPGLSVLIQQFRAAAALASAA